MFIFYIVLLVIYLGLGFMTAQDLQRIWSSGWLDFQGNAIIVFVGVLYFLGVAKILSKILYWKKNIMQQVNYKAAGILALFLVFSSFLWERNSLGAMLTAIVIVPYLLIVLRTLMLKKAQYQQPITVVIGFLVLLTILGPILIYSGYYKGVFLAAAAKGLGFIVLGVLILVEWRLYNILMRSIALLMVFLGVAYIHTSLFPFYPQVMMVMTKSSLEIYSTLKMLVLAIIYMLLGINFLRVHGKYDDNKSVDI